MRNKVKDFTQYEKDAFSKAVVNVDNKSLEAYKMQRKKMLEVNKIEKEFSDIKEEINEIKTLLKELINK